jgi:hypothetical protein
MRPAGIQEFKASLKETVDWCVPRFSMNDLIGSLRSEALQPSANIVQDADAVDVERAIADVIRRRSKLLQAESRKVPSGMSHRGTYLAGGKLLAHFPFLSLFHGLSVPETGGFIDVDEIPPWDTWVHFTGDFLVTWVPANLESAVQLAIDCNAEDSIVWLNDVVGDFVDAIRGEGLV